MAKQRLVYIELPRDKKLSILEALDILKQYLTPFVYTFRVRNITYTDRPTNLTTDEIHGFLRECVNPYIDCRRPKQGKITYNMDPSKDYKPNTDPVFKLRLYTANKSKLKLEDIDNIKNVCKNYNFTNVHNLLFNYFIEVHDYPEPLLDECMLQPEFYFKIKEQIFKNNWPKGEETVKNFLTNAANNMVSSEEEKYTLWSALDRFFTIATFKKERSREIEQALLIMKKNKRQEDDWERYIKNTGIEFVQELLNSKDPEDVKLATEALVDMI